MSSTTMPAARDTSPETQTGKKANVRWIYVGLPLLVVWAVNNVDKANLSVLFANAAFMQDTHIAGPMVAGLIASVFAWVYGVVQFIWGYLVEKVGPRLCTALGAVIWAISMAVGATAGSAGALMWFRGILGVGEGNSYPVSLTFTARWFPLKERARAQSVWYNGINIGPAIGLPLLALIIVKWGWRASFWVLGLFSLLTAVLVWWLTRDYPASHPACSAAEAEYISSASAGSGESTRESLSSLLKTVPFWLITAVYSFQAMAYWGVVIFLPSFLEKAKHITFAHSAYITGGSFVVAILFQLGFAYISDRLMRRALIAILGWIGVMVFMGVSVVSGGVVAAIMQMLVVGTLSMTGLMCITMAQHAIGRVHMGAGSGVFGGVTQLVSAFGPLLVGYVAGIGGFGFGMATMGVVLVVPIVCTLFLLFRYRIDSIDRA